MGLGPRLDIRVSQSLVMTQQLQAAIKLLALSNLEIEAAISINDIRDLVRELKQRDIGVLITGHSVRETLDVGGRPWLMYGMRVLFEGTPQALVADEQVRRLYLGESFAL